jgi:glycosyltransferase involved in cell wall biosynthesis
MTENTSTLPLVVYCLPIYNGAHILMNCVDSILKQTYGNVKILIGDNCSTDATQNICEKLAKENHKIVYIRHSKNNGCYWNYTNLMSQMGHMKAKYFVLAQDDSTYSPDHASKCIGFLEENENIVSCMTMLEVEINGRITSHCDNLDTVGLSLKDKIIKATKFDSRGLFYTGVHRSKAFENFRDVWYNLSTNRLTDLEILTFALIGGDSMVLRELLVKRTYSHTAMKPYEDYNAYLERHHVANNLRQGITLPFCNGIRKICHHIFQRTDIDINEILSVIDAFVPCVMNLYASSINSEIDRAISLVASNDFYTSWHPTTIAVDVSDLHKDKMMSIFLAKLHGDALDCYSFMKLEKLRKLIDLCSLKMAENSNC